MLLKCLQRADSLSGTPQAKAKALAKEALKDAKELAASELCRKILAPALRVPVGNAPVPVVSGSDVDVRIAVKSDADAARIAQQAAGKATFLQLKSKSKSAKGSTWIFSLNPKAFERQLASLKKFDRKQAETVLSSVTVRLSFLKETPAEKIEESGAPKSVLNASSLSHASFGIQKGKAYSKAALDRLVDAGLAKCQSIFPILKAVLDLARNGSSKQITVRHPASARDLAIAEDAFLPIAAAVSALHSNPKMQVKFTDSGFSLLLGKRPVGRFGPSLRGRLLRNLIRQCADECGAYGNPSRLLDVLDAEGQRKDVQIRELFNDLAKHVTTHSSGIAAKSALLLKEAAGVSGRLDWSGFDKALEKAKEDLRFGGRSLFVSNLQDAVVQMNSGRNVVDASRIQWEADILRNRLDWLGSLMADILEYEVCASARAMQTLSCTVDWMQNEVPCSLSLRYLGSSGIRISFQPCGAIVPKNWKLQLQNIMSTGAEWSPA